MTSQEMFEEINKIVNKQTDAEKLITFYALRPFIKEWLNTKIVNKTDILAVMANQTIHENQKCLNSIADLISMEIF